MTGTAEAGEGSTGRTRMVVSGSGTPQEAPTVILGHAVHSLSAPVVVMCAAVGAAVFGVIDGNSAMVLVSVVAAVGATAMRIYTQFRSTRREQDVADAQSRRDMSLFEQILKENDELRDDNDRLREQLVRLGVNPWQKEDAGGAPRP